MKKILLFSALLFAFAFTVPQAVLAEQQPEMIAEKMAVKFTRGVANTFTSIAELPKQTILTVRDMGPTGYLIGPLKGVGMTLYRGFIGMTEAVFFLVPQPGYYDPMIDPAYVWEGWEPKRDTTQAVSVVK
ncbi:MAG: exosortase system-associated protein, TIGR04073 family [Geobacter sp.]|nr:exosortase system-associated protein, TIGR04073 family [Geobacter sp.]